MVERISSGIDGLDQLLGGGIPNGSIVLLSGGTGCGKTIFSLQFLMEGIKKGQAGKFITLEQLPEEVRNDASDFGWDFAGAEANGLLEVISINPIGDRGFKDQIIRLIESSNASRIVIDSISVLLGTYENDNSKLREL